MKPTRSALQTLRQRIDSTSRNGRGRRRFSAELRREVVAATVAEVSQGIPLRVVAGKLGIGDSLLSRWVAAGGQPPAPRGLRAVEVVDEPRTFTLMGPGGFRVDGLSAEDLATLMLAADAR